LPRLKAPSEGCPATVLDVVPLAADFTDDQQRLRADQVAERLDDVQLSLGLVEVIPTLQVGALGRIRHDPCLVPVWTNAEHAGTDQVVAVDLHRHVDLVADLGRRRPAEQVGRGADAVDLDVFRVLPEADARLQVDVDAVGRQGAFDRLLEARQQAPEQGRRSGALPVTAVRI